MSQNWTQSLNPYVGEVQDILAKSTGRPKKVFDGVLTNEMALQRENFKTEAFDFEVGGMVPGLSSLINEKFYDANSEFLTLMVREIHLDVEIRFCDVINYYASFFTFPAEGGSNTVLVYLTNPTGELFVDNHNGGIDWTQSVINPCWIMPLIFSHSEFAGLIKATILDISASSKLNHPTYTSCMRLKYIECLVLRQTSGLSVFAIDFMNPLSEELLQAFRDNNGKPINLETWMKTNQKIYQRKTLDGALPLNELGFLLAALWRCSPGIFFPLNFYSSSGNIVFRKTIADMQVAAGLLTTWNNGDPTTTLDKNTFNKTYQQFFPQNYTPMTKDGRYVIIANTIKNWTSTPANGLNILLKLFPFYWIAYNLSDILTFEIFKNYQPAGLGQAIQTYSSYSVVPVTSQTAVASNTTKGGFNEFSIHFDTNTNHRHETVDLDVGGTPNPMRVIGTIDQQPDLEQSHGFITQTKRSQTSLNSIGKIVEPPIDFSSLFGSCNLFIEQCRSLRHNVRNQTITAAVKFLKKGSLSSFDGFYYKPELVESQNMNIWDENKREESIRNLPIHVRILTEKFGTPPPNVTNSKLNVCVSFYTYKKK